MAEIDAVTNDQESVRAVVLQWDPQCHDCGRLLNYGRWRQAGGRVTRFLPKVPSLPVLVFPVCSNGCYQGMQERRPAMLIAGVGKLELISGCTYLFAQAS